MNPTDDRPMAELMALIGHALQSHPLMEEALTHASYRNEHRDLCADNERLEFLGDSILGAAVSHLLSIAYPEAPEGVLTRYKAVLVSEPGLADMARTLGLGRFLRLGKGEELTGGRDKSSVLADAMEAVIAAVYLDAGFEAAFQLVKRLFSERIEAVGRAEERIDFKTKLQELVQLRHKVMPTYRIVEQSGPDHDRTFQSAVEVQGDVVATGSGRSKKEAEQEAAREAFAELMARAAPTE